jgi:glycerol kinase
MRKTSKGYGKQRFLSLYREPQHPATRQLRRIDQGTTSTRFMVWCLTRTRASLPSLRKNTGKSIRNQAGSSGLKLRWLLQNIPGAREKTASGDLLFGRVDTFLLSNLTGGAKGGVQVADVMNAGRTQPLSLKTLD